MCFFRTVNWIPTVTNTIVDPEITQAELVRSLPAWSLEKFKDS